MKNVIYFLCFVLLFFLVNLDESVRLHAQDTTPLPRVTKFGSTPYSGSIVTQNGHSTWCAFCSLAMISNGSYSPCVLAREYARMFKEAPLDLDCCFTSNMTSYKYCDGGVKLHDLGIFSWQLGLGWPHQWIGAAAFCNVNNIHASFPRLGLIDASSVHCVVVFCIMRYLLSDNISAEFFIYYIDPENGLPWTERGSIFIGN